MSNVAAEKEDGQRPLTRSQRWFRNFALGGVGVGAVLLWPASVYANHRAQASQEKAEDIIFDATGHYPARVGDSMPSEFYDQNQRTIELGDTTHYLRLAGGMAILLTASTSAGIAIGARRKEIESYFGLAELDQSTS